MEFICCDHCHKRIRVPNKTYIRFYKNHNNDYYWDLCDDCVRELKDKISYLFENYGNPYTPILEED